MAFTDEELANSPWIITENGLALKGFETIPQPMSKPYPLSLWRIDETVNNGMPYHEFLPGLKRITLVPQTHFPDIHIYGSRASYEELEANGLAVLEITEGTVRHEKNGVYSANATVPVSDNGKWQYITGKAIVKIPIKRHDIISNQLFRIVIPEKIMEDDGSEYVKFEAAHIFYDMSGKLLDDVRVVSKNANDAITHIMESVYGGWDASENDFSFSTDINRSSTAYYDGVSLTAALIGEDNSIINRWGGSLYRDNYHFSINSKMQNCRETGVISYSNNMKAITFTADYSECITRLIAVDNFEHRKVIVNPDVTSAEFPHHITKKVRFFYEEDNLAQFEEDAQAYFDNFKQPNINIKVKIAELPDTPEYEGFKNLRDFEVGDKVIIYHKNLDINYGNLEIIVTEMDIKTLEKTSVEIGNFKNAVNRTEFMAHTVSTSATAADKQTAAMKSQLDDVTFATYIPTPIATVDGRLLTTSDGKYLLYKKG